MEIDSNWVIENLCDEYGNFIKGKYSKEYLNSIGVFADIQNKFPNITSVKEMLYLIKNNMTEPPECSNPLCHNKLKFKTFLNKYAVTCCNKCQGVYQSYIKSGRLITSMDDVISQKEINDMLKIVRTYPTSQELIHDIETKHKPRNHSKETSEKKRSLEARIYNQRLKQMKSVYTWAARGLDIEYINNSEVDLKDVTVVVKNCCEIHGSQNFTVNEFNRRSRRRNKYTMCPTCNPIICRSNEFTTEAHLTIENVLKELDIKYIRKSYDYCNPFQVDFILQDYDIAIYVINPLYNYGIDLFKKITQMNYIANKNGHKDVCFIFTDDAENRNKMLRYIKSLIDSEPIMLHPEEKRHKYFFINKHTFSRTYNKKSIKSDFKSWRIQFVI